MRLERGEERVQLLPAAAHQRLHLRPGALKEPAALRFEAPRLLRSLGSLGRERRALAGHRLALARDRFPLGLDRLEDLRQVGVLARARAAGLLDDPRIQTEALGDGKRVAAARGADEQPEGGPQRGLVEL